jgi:hypothetical protein
LHNSKTQGVIQGLHPFADAQFILGDDLQSILVAELADPPEEVSLHQLLYVFSLFFSALGTDNFPDDLHFHPGPEVLRRKLLLKIILGEFGSIVNGRISLAFFCTFGLCLSRTEVGLDDRRIAAYL